jgi:DNA-binding transcriptional MocR family regulator
MWVPDLTRRKGPLAVTLADAIGDAVQAGRLSPGDKLPPQRDLAIELGIAVTTITRAYAEAERRGLVVGEVGRGTFVRTPAFGSRHEREPGAVDLSINALLPHAHAAELIRRFGAITASLPASRLLDYQSHFGRPELRASASDWIRRWGVDAPAEELVLAVGAQHALAAVFGALCAPGDEVLVEPLTYSGMKAVASFVRVRLTPVPADRDGVLPDGLEGAAARGRARLLYCMPNVHNPTGVTLSARRRKELAAAADRAGITIIEDDSYGFLADKLLTPLTALIPERCIYVSSLSKSVAPALRVGFVRAPRHLLSRVADFIYATTVMVAAPTAEVASAWIADGTADRIVKWKRAEMTARGALARRHLRTLRGVTPMNSPHLWLNLPRRWTADDFAREARSRGIIITPARAFAAGPDAPEAIRVCIGAAADRTVMVEALRTLDALARDPRVAFSAVV